jgi:beta-lactamase class A
MFPSGSSALLRSVPLVLVLALAGCSTGRSTDPASASGTARATSTPSAAPSVSPTDRATFEAAVLRLEDRYDATVGIVAIDTGTGAMLTYGADRRFGYASTLKAFAAAEFLRTVRGAARDEVARWTAEDVAAAGHSPVTSRHVSDGLTWAQLAEAAVRESDNTAMNLLLERIGGPSALQAGLARLGDSTTEVVHDEPDLNTIAPGSTDDTTTAAAFAADLHAVLGGGPIGLDDADRATLLGWMGGNVTGDTLVRAGTPAGWTVADKSGGAGGIRNDVT